MTDTELFKSNLIIKVKAWRISEQLSDDARRRTFFTACSASAPPFCITCLPTPHRLSSLSLSTVFQEDQFLSDSFHTHHSTDICSTDPQPWLYRTLPLCSWDFCSSFTLWEVSHYRTELPQPSCVQSFFSFLLFWKTDRKPTERMPVRKNTPSDFFGSWKSCRSTACTETLFSCRTHFVLSCVQLLCELQRCGGAHPSAYPLVVVVWL